MDKDARKRARSARPFRSLSSRPAYGLPCGLPSALSLWLRARGLRPLVSGLLAVRGRGVGRAGGSAYGLRFTPLFPFIPAPLIARRVGRVGGFGGAGARSRSQSFRVYMPTGSRPAPRYSAVLACPLRAPRGRLRVPWLTRSDARNWVITPGACVRRRRCAGSPPGAARSFLPRSRPSPFGLGRAAAVAPCRRAPLRYAPGRGVTPALGHHARGSGGTRLPPRLTPLPSPLRAVLTYPFWLLRGGSPRAAPARLRTPFRVYGGAAPMPPR